LNPCIPNGPVESRGIEPSVEPNAPPSGLTAKLESLDHAAKSSIATAAETTSHSRPVDEVAWFLDIAFILLFLLLLSASAGRVCRICGDRKFPLAIAPGR
jgi:hypothetical protein